ncbi:hypothetical protein O3G_MSEX001810 [Manduca sexta]|uniref:Uncharacterized protein n=1 Tax=Manduca sexta TaxID=7130 RepID=A0A921YMP7_MANSE|nr:hypothetical protein O3G_MSEX001810 [Manduca sexta]
MHSRSVQFNIVTEHRPRRLPPAHSRSVNTFTMLFHWHHDTYLCHITLSPWTLTESEGWHSWVGPPGSAPLGLPLAPALYRITRTTSLSNPVNIHVFTRDVSSMFGIPHDDRRSGRRNR